MSTNHGAPGRALDEALERARGWVGRSRTATGLITAAPADILAATFDRDDAPLADGDPIPPGWHWYYFPEVVKLSETGADGHAARGSFMPPVPLPRRMWAGVRMRFDRPLRVGETATRVSTVADVTPKTGRTGTLCFVTVRHEISGEAGLATLEEHTTVYRGDAAGAAARPGAAAPPQVPEAVWSREVDPTTVLLFRYSALTMNSHRIHYDRDYVTGAEGYPGLLVHGNLTATLLLDLFRRARPHAALRTFAVRALAPLFDGAPFTVAGAPGPGPGEGRLWALTPAGGLAQSAEIAFED